jgi:RND family efflux transporter MFP subunit
MKNSAQRRPHTGYWLAVSAIYAGMLAGCSGEAGKEQEIHVRPAKLIEISTSTDTRTITLPAVIEAVNSAELTFQVGGLLGELPVREGDKVEQGAVIARLDQRDFKNEVSMAKAQAENADSEFLRAEKLIKENAVSQSVFEQRKAQRDVARAALDTVTKRLDDATLHAPFAGVVATVHSEAFQNVAPQEPIVTLQTTGAAEAAVQVPARLVANSGRVEPEETMVILDAVPDVRIPAVLRSTATQADPNTQTFLANFSFTPPESLVILPGMTGSVRVRLKLAGADGSTTQTTVPAAAVLPDGDGLYVWLVNEESMTVSRRDITIVPGIGETLTVEEGLEAGDVVVGAGASYLHEGMQIRRYEP